MAPPPPIDPVEDAARRAAIADVRQALTAPVAAIRQYARMARNDGVLLGREQVMDDLDRVIAATDALSDLVDRLMVPDTVQVLAGADDLLQAERRYRHDLRTPINAIKGYGELILEDLAEDGLTATLPDLVAMLAETDRLLGSLEGIVRFSRGAGASEAPIRATARNVARSVAWHRLPAGEGIAPARVLVVDDNETNCALLQRQMQRDGHTAVLAVDGYAALDCVRQEPFDLVLLDLMMPGIDGLDVLRQLKADPATAELSVVVVSALDELDSVVRCLQEGAEDYMTKPFDPVLLKTRVDAILERRQLRAREREMLDALTEEKCKSDTLLRSILPAPVVARINDGETQIADRHDDVTVLFCDVVGFTQLSAAMSPSRLVDNLDRLFRRFDALAQRYGVEKIKTIGDAYMAVAGLPTPHAGHARAALALGQAMIRSLGEATADFGHPVAVRLGLHSGPVTAGVIGSHRFIYDVWGDTVNVASRLEGLGAPNRIHMSEATAQLLGGDLPLECRGSMAIKGKGEMTTYLL